MGRDGDLILPRVQLTYIRIFPKNISCFGTKKKYCDRVRSAVKKVLQNYEVTLTNYVTIHRLENAVFVLEINEFGQINWCFMCIHYAH